MKHKNAILMLIAIVLFIYAGILTLFPLMLNSSFSIKNFEEKALKSTNGTISTRLGKVRFSMKPNLNLVISVSNLSEKYCSKVIQPLLDVGYMEITTNPTCIFSKVFKIKDMQLVNVTFENQTLSGGINKLAYLPSSFNANAFGAKKIVISPSDIKIKKLLIKDIASGYYKENRYKNMVFKKSDVKKFLFKYKYNTVEIR